MVLTLDDLNRCELIFPDSLPEAVFAAAEFRKYVEKMTGTHWRKNGDFRIIFEATDDSRIYFDGFRIVCEDAAVRIQANLPRGWVNGVYTLLFDWGCRWVWLKDEIVPSLDSLVFKDKIVNPDLEFRGVCIFSVNRENIPILRDIIDWLGKNRFNLFMTSVSRTKKRPDGWEVEWEDVADELQGELTKRGIILNISEHSGRYFFPVAYFEQHPEWFALNKDGQRFDSGQICYGNPEAVMQLAANFVAYAKAHPEVKILGTWPEDGYGFCQCQECKKSGTVLRAVNKIAAAVAEIRPDMLIEYLSYTSETSDVPPDAEIHPNIITLVANTRVAGEWLVKARKAGAQGVYRLSYQIADNTAARADLSLRFNATRNDCRDAKSLGLRGIVPFFIGTDTQWRSHLNLYFLSRFAWDVELESDAVLLDLVQHYFATKTIAMNQLFSALENMPLVNQNTPPPWDLWQNWPEMKTIYSGAAYLEIEQKFVYLRQLLGEAEKSTDPTIKRHCVAIGKMIEFRRKMFEMWHCRALAVEAFEHNNSSEVKKFIIETGRIEQILADEVHGADSRIYGVNGAWTDYKFFMNWRLQLDKQLLEMRTCDNKKTVIDQNPDVEMFLPGLLKL